jgi:hypothetical protein
VEWSGMVWNGLKRCGMVWNGMEWFGMAWNSVEWSRMAWNGLEWCGIVGNGSAKWLLLVLNRKVWPGEYVCTFIRILSGYFPRICFQYVNGLTIHISYRCYSCCPISYNSLPKSHIYYIFVKKFLRCLGSTYDI